ncbi:carbohydrate ABC transporter permease [Conexibacter woesei]|uniref:Binding-protein-dependent transport systems inner membrane component n=1 Tax=Conexibacter woesei (strain DSM 14684 / CCUG 47730 / CIP 108061 / JCM 11494 / NBRC 100937 / ID131577) TaxID=469383 RepID=D3F7X2_CONWI|nr:carbohydrate ABC transporter permease [Conexibacter woesei]ADB52866.1 binding-protein-dependent transport systems inner membrane component [Conexibacter woesei DSM 14684]
MNVSRTERSLTYAVLWVFAGFAVAPIVLVLFAALQRPDALITGVPFPTGFHLDTFERAWTVGHFEQYLISSAIVTISVVVITTVLSVLAGYAFGSMRFRGSTALFYLFILGLIIPHEALVIPLYFRMRDVGLTDTYLSLILPQSAISLAFGIFWMRAYFRSAPRTLIEAARLEGASSLTVLRQVLLPLAKPAITTLVVLTFMWNWNEFLLPLIMISSESHRTTPLGLAFFTVGHRTNVVELAAASVLIAAPVVAVYIFMQRRFISGMLNGAVKG